MGSRAVGGFGAGCAGFSLVGLLVGVGLVFWLGSQATDSVSGPSPSGDDSTSVPVDVSALQEMTIPGSTLRDARVVLAPADGLGASDVVAVTGTGLPPGPIEVSTCLTHDFRSSDGLSGCDQATTVGATVDAAGTFTLDFPVNRVLTVLGLPNDCAAFAGACSVVVHPAGAYDDGPSSPLAFTTDLPPIDAERPPEG